MGMYVTSTFALAQAFGLSSLQVLAHWPLFVVLPIWLVVFVGLVNHLLTRLPGGELSERTRRN
jgi:hypothetical protein